MSALCPTAAACNWPSLRTGLQCAFDRSLLTSVTTAFSAPVSPVTTSVVRDGVADGEAVGPADGLPADGSDGITGAAAPGKRTAAEGVGVTTLADGTGIDGGGQRLAPPPRRRPTPAGWHGWGCGMRDGSTTIRRVSRCVTDSVDGRGRPGTATGRAGT